MPEEKGPVAVASREPFSKYPADAYDIFALQKIPLPSYAVRVNLNLFPTTEPELPDDFEESELEEILRKLNRGAALTEREMRIWRYFDPGEAKYR
jgi:hypothetical protein